MTDTNRKDLKEQVSWQGGPKQRSGFAIIWSCLARVVTCTWTVLHLNVPSHHDTFWTKFFRNLKWMIIMIIYPELVFSHAVLELKMALYDYFSMNECKEHLLRLEWRIHLRKGSQIMHQILSGPWTEKPWEEDIVVPRFGTFKTRKRPTTTKTSEDAQGVAQHQFPNDSVMFDHSHKQHVTIWTLTHSYLANMGGILERHVTIPGYILVSDTPRADNLMRNNRISKAEI